jgi:glycosyltransferase involved in cell wall biosynthesis
MNLGIDVVMCSWNSNKPFFGQCLESIRREVPIHHFILVDRYSQDGTVELVQKTFDDPQIIRTNENLGKAREIGIGQVDTDLFAFIDSDVELSKGWFDKLISYMNEDVGGINELTDPTLISNPVWRKMILWKTQREDESGFIVDIDKNTSGVRGFTLATLLRTKLVKDWKCNPKLCAFEDYVLHTLAVNFGRTFTSEQRVKRILAAWEASLTNYALARLMSLILENWLV